MCRIGGSIRGGNGSISIESERGIEIRVSAAAAKRSLEGEEIQEVHVEGNLAYIVTQLSVDVTPPGGPTTRRTGNTLSVLRKQGGRWQLARDANLLTPVKL